MNFCQSELLPELLPIRWYMWKSFINDIYKPMTKQLKNTVIPFSRIRSFPNEYQKLLERKVDFLLEDDWWWREKVMVSSLLILHDIATFSIKNYTRSHNSSSKMLGRLH